MRKKNSRNNYSGGEWQQEKVRMRKEMGDKGRENQREGEREREKKIQGGGRINEKTGMVREN